MAKIRAFKLEEKDHAPFLKSRWEFENFPKIATPVIADGVLYTLAAHTILYALDAATGQKLYSSVEAVTADAHSGLAVANGRVCFGRIRSDDVLFRSPIRAVSVDSIEWVFVSLNMRSLKWPFVLALVLVAKAELPDGPGKAATVKICGKCHSPEKAASLHQDEDAWTDTISKMVKMGAQGTDDEFNTVLAYLTKNFGPQAATAVNINKADSVELESSLVLTRTEAAAVIQYRTDKGAFKTLEDLRNVPGLDFSKIETQKARITF